MRTFIIITAFDSALFFQMSQSPVTLADVEAVEQLRRKLKRIRHHRAHMNGVFELGERLFVIHHIPAAIVNVGFSRQLDALSLELKTLEEKNEDLAVDVGVSTLERKRLATLNAQLFCDISNLESMRTALQQNIVRIARSKNMKYEAECTVQKKLKMVGKCHNHLTTGLRESKSRLQIEREKWGATEDAMSAHRAQLDSLKRTLQHYQLVIPTISWSRICAEGNTSERINDGALQCPTSSAGFASTAQPWLFRCCDEPLCQQGRQQLLLLAHSQPLS